MVTQPRTHTHIYTHGHAHSYSRVTGLATKQATAYVDWQSCNAGVYVGVCSCTQVSREKERETAQQGAKAAQSLNQITGRN